MKLEKITNKLSEFFELSDKKQLKKKNQENLNKIVRKLKANKEKLKAQIQQEGEINETSDRYQELDKEYKVVKKLLKRAKKQYSMESSDE